MDSTVDGLTVRIAGVARRRVEQRQRHTLTVESVTAEFLHVQKEACYAAGPPVGASPIERVFPGGKMIVFEGVLKHYIPVLNLHLSSVSPTSRRWWSRSPDGSQRFYHTILAMGATVRDRQVLATGAECRWKTAVVAVWLVNVLDLAGFQAENDEADLDRRIAGLLAGDPRRLLRPCVKLMCQWLTPPVRPI